MLFCIGALMSNPALFKLTRPTGGLKHTWFQIITRFLLCFAEDDRPCLDGLWWNWAACMRSDNYCWRRSDRVILVCCCYLRLDYDFVLSFLGKNNHGTVWIFLLYKPLILLSIYNVKVGYLSPFPRLFAWFARVTSAALGHWHKTHPSGLQDFLLHIH